METINKKLFYFTYNSMVSLENFHLLNTAKLMTVIRIVREIFSGLSKPPHCLGFGFIRFQICRNKAFFPLVANDYVKDSTSEGRN